MQIMIRPSVPLTQSRTPFADPGAVFDFGYIGDYYREEEACEHHLANPAPPLLIAVADPLLRQHVEYKALAPFDTFNNKGGVPINQQQYDIVDGLQHSIECIQGPPGTGKSTTIFHIITQRLEDGAVALATCVQNKAVDAIAEKLGGRIPFFVFGNDDRLGLIAKQYTIEGQVKRHPDVLAAQAFIGELSKGAKVVNRAVAEVFGTAAWLYSDRRTRRRKDRAAEVYPMSASDCQEKRDAFMANDGWRRLWEAHIKQRHPLLFTLKRKLRAIRIQALGMLQRLEDRLRLEIVADARAILCTVASTGSLMYHEDIEPCVSRITTVIFDEAGTSPESKLPVLLLLPTLEKIIAIGDQKQLSPFTQLDDPTSNQCFAFVEGRCRFGASCKFRHGGGGCLPDGFFQRAEKALVVVPTMTTQYRMHPAICSLVSDLYYGGLLETPGWIAADRRAVDALGVYWHNSFGRESKARSGGPSTQNEDEADDVLDVYRRERARLTARRETGGSIMIITFYKAQQFHLRRLFEDAGFSEGEHLRITTVDQSQGSEADVVILSTVRSNPTRAIGFLKNPNRLNVAISRAREKLVVVGNQRTVGSTPDWARIVAASNAWE